MARACTLFLTDNYGYEDWPLCRCPACSGFLPRNFPIGEQFLCRKCGAVLETLPSLTEDPDEEEDTDCEFGGRICVVPEEAIKISTELPPKQRTHRKKKTDLWAMGAAFARRVWEDKDGRFIEIDGERIELSDPRILKAVQDKEAS